MIPDTSLTQASVYELLKLYMKFGSWKMNGTVARCDTRLERRGVVTPLSDHNDRECLDDDFGLILCKLLLQTYSYLSPSAFVQENLWGLLE